MTYFSFVASCHVQGRIPYGRNSDKRAVIPANCEAEAAVLAMKLFCEFTGMTEAKYAAILLPVLTSLLMRACACCSLQIQHPDCQAHSNLLHYWHCLIALQKSIERWLTPLPSTVMRLPISFAVCDYAIVT